MHVLHDDCPSSLPFVAIRLLTGSLALSDDIGHLVNLALRTAESSESLLCKLASTLVLAVAEKFDNAALVWCEAVGAYVSICLRDVEAIVGSGYIARLQAGWGVKTYPETSLTMSRTKAVRLLRWPFMRETRGFTERGVTFCMVKNSLADIPVCEDRADIGGVDVRGHG